MIPVPFLGPVGFPPPEALEHTADKRAAMAHQAAEDLRAGVRGADEAMAALGRSWVDKLNG